MKYTCFDMTWFIGFLLFIENNIKDLALLLLLNKRRKAPLFSKRNLSPDCGVTEGDFFCLFRPSWMFLMSAQIHYHNHHVQVIASQQLTLNFLVFLFGTRIVHVFFLRLSHSLRRWLFRHSATSSSPTSGHFYHPTAHKLEEWRFSPFYTCSGAFYWPPIFYWHVNGNFMGQRWRWHFLWLCCPPSKKWLYEWIFLFYISWKSVLMKNLHLRSQFVGYCETSRFVQ